MSLDSIPDSYFADKRFTREDLRAAIYQLIAELGSVEMAEALDAEGDES